MGTSDERALRLEALRLAQAYGSGAGMLADGVVEMLAGAAKAEDKGEPDREFRKGVVRGEAAARRRVLDLLDRWRFGGPSANPARGTGWLYNEAESYRRGYLAALEEARSAIFREAYDEAPGGVSP